MTDSYDDLETPSIQSTYCHKHKVGKGLWAHECPDCRAEKLKLNQKNKKKGYKMNHEKIAQKIVDELNEKYAIGTFSQFGEEPADFDSTADEELKEIIINILKEENA